MLTPEQQSRFWKKVEKGGGCWLWTGCVSERTGYGWFGVWRGERKGAHRWAWEIANGQPVPAGLVVMHKCDNRRCVNPDHLTVGTHGDNIGDMHSKGRWCDRKGEKHPLAELTPEIAKAIKYGAHTAKEASELYCVSLSTAFKIKSGKRWAHI